MAGPTNQVRRVRRSRSGSPLLSSRRKNEGSSQTPPERFPAEVPREHRAYAISGAPALEDLARGGSPGRGCGPELQWGSMGSMFAAAKGREGRIRRRWQSTGTPGGAEEGLRRGRQAAVNTKRRNTLKSSLSALDEQSRGADAGQKRAARKVQIQLIPKSWRRQQQWMRWGLGGAHDAISKPMTQKWGSVSGVVELLV
ncbi:hypothetical protein GGX14DRAFT_397893 [Mycena pura]|uniref:Uncharacterized protein n=1 Tax=Mycena pura TaxID=153505 RepID=A0AAD6V882_9AGAR|nr:hypothetical protein GGX14DRAFT_397893 [Mycena pura]